MERGQHEIDDLLKDKLGDYKIQFDESYWEEAQKGFSANEKTKNKGIAYWGIRTLSAVVLLVGIYFTLDFLTQDSSKLINQNQHTQSQNKTPLSNKTNTSPLNHGKSTIVSTEKTNETNVKLTEQQNQVDKSHSRVTTSSSTDTPNQNTSNSVSHLESYTSPHQPKSNIPTKQNRGSKVPASIISKSKIAGSASIQKQTSNLVNGITADITHQTPKSNISTNQNKSSESNSNGVKPNDINTILSNQYHTSDKLSSNNQQSKSGNEEKISIDLPNHNEDNIINTPSKTKNSKLANNRIQPLNHTNTVNNNDNLALYLLKKELEHQKLNSNEVLLPSVEHINKKLSRKSLTFFLEYGHFESSLKNGNSDQITIRSANQTSISLNVEIPVLNNFGIITGVNKNTFRENLKYNLHTSEDTNFTLIIDKGHWNIINYKRYLFDTTWVQGVPFVRGEYKNVSDSNYVKNDVKKDTTVSDTTKSDILAGNIINYIEVPLLLSYRYQFKNLEFFIATGPSFGYVYSAQGSIRDLNDPFKEYRYNDRNQFNEIVINYNFRALAVYNLNENWGIVAEPVFKTNITSFLKSSTGIKRKYNHFGIRAGIVYKF